MDVYVVAYVSAIIKNDVQVSLKFDVIDGLYVFSTFSLNKGFVVPAIQCSEIWTLFPTNT